MISIKDFEKLEMKVGEIISADDVPKADRIYKLEVDVGGRQITLIAGIKRDYEKDELIGKKIIVLTNLEPVMIKGIKSEGMLLAAIGKDKVSLVTIDRDISVGSDVA
jgi:methionine--tRNA ligase beta chain